MCQNILHSEEIHWRKFQPHPARGRTNVSAPTIVQSFALANLTRWELPLGFATRPPHWLSRGCAPHRIIRKHSPTPNAPNWVPHESAMPSHHTPPNYHPTNYLANNITECASIMHGSATFYGEYNGPPITENTLINTNPYLPSIRIALRLSPVMPTSPVTILHPSARAGQNFQSLGAIEFLALCKRNAWRQT